MKHDEIERLSRRCPRLGGLIEFNYCLNSQESTLPCFKIFDCWWEYFDITTYLTQVLPEKTLQQLMHIKPKPKVQSIVELIDQAQKRTGA